MLEDLANSLRGLSSNENTPTKKVKVLKIEDERKSTKKALFDDKSVYTNFMENASILIV